MAAAGRVSQSFDAKTLTYTDESTGIGTVTNRVLKIYDANGEELTSIIMGGVTATYLISKDRYLKFIETISIQAGADVVVTVNYMSKQFYRLAQVNKSIFGCGCKDALCSDKTKASAAIEEADTKFNIGDGPNCQFLLDAANLLIS